MRAQITPSPTSALEIMEPGRSEPPPPTLSAAPNKSIRKTFFYSFGRLKSLSSKDHGRQSGSRINSYLNWNVHAGSRVSHTEQPMKLSQDRSVQCPMEMKATAAG